MSTDLTIGPCASFQIYVVYRSDTCDIIEVGVLDRRKLLFPTCLLAHAGHSDQSDLPKANFSHNQRSKSTTNREDGSCFVQNPHPGTCRVPAYYCRVSREEPRVYHRLRPGVYDGRGFEDCTTKPH